MERGTNVVAWHLLFDAKKKKSSRDSSRCCESPCGLLSKQSPAKSCSVSEPYPDPLLGTLTCILPGQVISQSPPRKAPPASKRMNSKHCSPRRPHLPKGLSKNGASDNSCLPTSLIFCEDFDDSSSCNNVAGSDNSEKAQTCAKRIDGSMSSTAPSGCDTNKEEDNASPFHSPRKRRDISYGATLGEAGDAVDHLIARCMTHERPTALVQASSVLLQACIVRLGEEASPNERKSDSIRRMLRLTDSIRRYNAELTSGEQPDS